MKRTDRKLLVPSGRRWLVAVVAALLCCGYAIPASAADFEQVGCFAGTGSDPCAPLAEGEEFDEEVQLAGVSGMAVNYSGAGGVAKGTVYAVTKGNFDTRVAMFEPVAGSGDLGEGSDTVTDLKMTAGAFSVGQAIKGPGILLQGRTDRFGGAGDP